MSLIAVIGSLAVAVLVAAFVVALIKDEHLR